MGAKSTWRGARAIVDSGWFGFDVMGGFDVGVEM